MIGVLVNNDIEPSCYENISISWRIENETFN